MNENNFCCPNEIFNIASNNPIKLDLFIKLIEGLNKKAKINYCRQPGDVPTTYASVDNLIAKINYSPKTTIEETLKNFYNGIRNFIRMTNIVYSTI